MVTTLETGRKKLLKIGIIGASAPLSVSIACASSAHHAGSVADLFWPAVNFTIFVVILFLLLRKKVVVGAANRSVDIARQVEMRKSELSAAVLRLNQANQRAEELDSSLRQIVEMVKREAATEVQFVLDDAQERVQRLSSQYKDAAATETKAAATSLRRELVEAVIANAEAKIRATVDRSKDSSYRASAVKRVTQISLAN